MRGSMTGKYELLMKYPKLGTEAIIRTYRFDGGVLLSQHILVAVIRQRNSRHKESMLVS